MKVKRKSVKGNKGGFEMMQPCYETILQIGNIETVNSHADDNFDQERLDPLIAEEMILEAVERTKSSLQFRQLTKMGILYWMKMVIKSNGVVLK